MFDLFAHRSPQYSKNAEKCGKYSPCVLCGQAVKNERYMVHMHQGGAYLVTEEEAETLPESADMGFYPLGTTCYRNTPDIHPYVTDTKERKKK